MTSPINPVLGGGDPYRKADSVRPSAREVRDFHSNSDLDAGAQAHHHSLGPNSNQASDGAHTHDGKSSKTVLLSDIVKTAPTVTGAKAGNAALTSLLTQLASIGIITDSTT